MKYKNITANPLSVRGLVANPGEVFDASGYVTDNDKSISVMRQLSEVSITYTIRFMLDDGITIYSEIVGAAGTVINSPTPPESILNPGYAFDGWYTQLSGAGSKIDFPYTLTANISVYSQFTDSAYAPAYPLNPYQDWTVNTASLPEVGRADNESQTLLYYQIHHPDGCPFEVGDTLEAYISTEEGSFVLERTITQSNPPKFDVLEFAGIDEGEETETLCKIYIGYKFTNDEVVAADPEYILIEAVELIGGFGSVGFVAFDYPRTTYFEDMAISQYTEGSRYTRQGPGEYVEHQLPAEYTTGTTYYRKSSTKTWEFDSEGTSQPIEWSLYSEASEAVPYTLMSTILSLDKYPQNYNGDQSCALSISSTGKALTKVINMSEGFAFLGDNIQTLFNLNTFVNFGFIGGYVHIDFMDGKFNVQDTVYDKDGKVVQHPVVLLAPLLPGQSIEDITIKVDFTPMLPCQLSYPDNTMNMTFESAISGYVTERDKYAVNDIIYVEGLKLKVYEVFSGNAGYREEFDMRPRVLEELTMVNDEIYGLCFQSDNLRILCNSVVEASEGPVLVRGRGLIVQILNPNIAYVTFDLLENYFMRICENNNKGLNYKSTRLKLGGSFEYVYLDYTYSNQAGPVGELKFGYNVPYQNYQVDEEYLTYLYYGYDDPMYIKKFIYENGKFHIDDPENHSQILAEILVGKHIDSSGNITDAPNNTACLIYQQNEWGGGVEKLYLQSPNNYDIDSRYNIDYETHVPYPHNGFINEGMLGIGDAAFDVSTLIGKSFTLHYIHEDYTQTSELLTFVQSEITDGEGHYAIEATNSAGSVSVMYDVEYGFDPREFRYKPVNENVPDPVVYGIHSGLILFYKDLSPSVIHIMFNTTDYGIDNYYNSYPYDYHPDHYDDD